MYEKRDGDSDFPKKRKIFQMVWICLLKKSLIVPSSHKETTSERTEFF